MKSLFRRADATQSRLCLILGESEIERGVVAMKDLALKLQTDVPRSEVVARVKQQLATPVPAGGASS